MSLDLTRLREAVERSNKLARDGNGDGFYVPDVEIFLTASRTLVEAAQVWWCTVSQKKMPGAGNRTVHCQLMMVTDGTHSDCGWVALVPVAEDSE